MRLKVRQKVQAIGYCSDRGGDDRTSDARACFAHSDCLSSLCLPPHRHAEVRQTQSAGEVGSISAVSVAMSTRTTALAVHRLRGLGEARWYIGAWSRQSRGRRSWAQDSGSRPTRPAGEKGVSAGDLFPVAGTPLCDVALQQRRARDLQQQDRHTILPVDRDRFRGASGISGHDAGTVSYCSVLVLRIGPTR